MQRGENSVFVKVLQIGEDHVDFRGGIGAVIASYQRFLPQFQSICSHRPLSSLGKIICFLRGYLRLWYTLVTRPSIKILHIHGSYGASVYRKAVIAFTGRFFFRKKIIYHIHSSEYLTKYDAGSGVYRKLCRYLIERADAVICLTPYWKEAFSKKFATRRIRVVYNMIAPPDKKIQVQQRVAHRPLELLFMGLIDRKKGVFDLVEMAKEKKDELEGKVVFRLGGAGKTDSLKTAIKKYQLRNIIDYRGWITESEKNGYFDAADVYILPSHNEGLPISILEAMSHGLPVIASRVGGIPEIMQHNVNGFLIEKGDAAGLLKAIQRYEGNNALLKEHSEASLRLVRAFYPENIVPQLEAVYRGLLPLQEKKLRPKFYTTHCE
ncbi:glycosyltransferase family 4 protein [Flavihumibacter petaseus]|uniref:Putative glycosyltransferase n=1 Tax=Flavihumibacter petaseus NBRC 106054 TaxID=1220578 RepID=A0A0E9N4Z4_9BACT|nr:glycosyltransferase family 4 protein [Flavihumibacter petaseus]GAO44884.1 putative glycosyltransferase [Flavihumibacter petaseus NBRC 106054]